MCQLLNKDLERRGFDVTWRVDGREALAVVAGAPIDVVLTDLRMPGFSGIELCKAIVAARPDVPVIVVTAFGSMENAIEALRAGAYDFVTKPFELDMIALVLERTVKHRALQEEVRRLERVVEQSLGSGELLGQSPAMRRLRSQIDRVADSEATVLVTGESGTGKEVIARSLHARSRRRDGPFVAVNCAALPEALLESELFGHTRGAFTDAREKRKGLFQQADGGTLLLDEVGEIPLTLQPKLLRALEGGHVRPVGSDAEVAVDVRVIAATNRDLEHRVETRTFREDLFFRLNVITLQAPPLRASGGDILLLAQRFIDQYAERAGKRVSAMTAQAAKKLMAYHWPGNVRELRNAMEHAVAWTQYDKLVADDLPDKVRDYEEQSIAFGGTDPAALVPLEDVERRYILHVLDSSGGNRSAAAKILGLDRKTLYRKLQRYARSGSSGSSTEDDDTPSG